MIIKFAQGEGQSLMQSLLTLLLYLQILEKATGTIVLNRGTENGSIELDDDLKEANA